MLGAATRSAKLIGAGTAQTTEDASLLDLLGQLYSEQLILDPHNPYLVAHGSPKTIDNQIRTFHWYRPYLQDNATVLDWGCNHAPDSCLLRACYGDRLDLHSCDFVDSDRYRVFQDFAGTAHKQLDDPFRLPYPSNSFDAVIGSGVLEHAANDSESLKELYRVIKPDGLLVISYLPNWLSFGEWRRRVVQKKDFHRRLYGMAEAKQLLKHNGFYPFVADYHTFFWERLLAAAGLSRWERGLSRILPRLLPLQVFSSTLRLLARKVTVM